MERPAPGFELVSGPRGLHDVEETMTGVAGIASPRRAPCGRPPARGVGEVGRAWGHRAGPPCGPIHLRAIRFTGPRIPAYGRIARMAAVTIASMGYTHLKTRNW